MPALVRVPLALLVVSVAVLQLTPNTVPAGAAPAAVNVRRAALNGIDCTSAQFCMAVGEAYEGGIFTQIAERWDGQAWTLDPLPSVWPSYSAQLTDVSCVSLTFCMAVGFVNDEPSRGYSITWDGTSWHDKWMTVQDGQNFLHGVSCYAVDRCMAVGYYTTDHGFWPYTEVWSGHGWKNRPVPMPVQTVSAEMYSIDCASRFACVATGTLRTSGSSAPLVERWTGTQWTLQGGAMTADVAGADLYGSDCLVASFCMVVGAKTPLTGPSIRVVERWNGGAWNNLGVIERPGGLYRDIACVSRHDCVAVGTRDSGRFFQATAERWNGKTWTLQTVPLPTTHTHLVTQLLAVDCPTATRCFAVGRTDFGQNAETLLERWNGQAWVVQSTPDPFAAS